MKPDNAGLSAGAFLKNGGFSRLSGTGNTVLGDLAALLTYPRAGFRSLAEQSMTRLRAAAPEAAAALEIFAGTVSQKSEAELEELFTAAFDMNPAAALEIGWHLYGENYERGAFLVLMRGHMRRLGVREGRELPDYLPNVLAALDRMEDCDARGLAREKILPALGKIRKALAGSPYDGVLRAIELFLESGQRRSEVAK